MGDSWKRMRFGFAGLALAALLVAGCNGDDEEAETTATPTVTTTATATATTAATPATTPTAAPSPAAAAVKPVEVTAVDYAFEGLPHNVEAGTMLTLQNDSKGEAHELVAVLLPDDERRPVEELLQLTQEEQQAISPGPPAALIVALPGEEGKALLGDGTLTEPGRYIILCGIPTGADPEEVAKALAGPPSAEPPALEGGPPHFTLGMFAELIVE